MIATFQPKKEEKKKELFKMVIKGWAEVKKQRRSEVALIKHLVDSIADPLQVGTVNLRWPVQSCQEVAISKVIEDVVNTRVALGCQVTLDGLVQQVAALIQNAAYDPSVEGELNLVETDRRHGQSVDFLPAVEK